MTPLEFQVRTRGKDKVLGFLAGLAFWFLIAALQALGGAVTDNPSAIVSTQPQR
jgi:hypothetical protein